MGFEGVASHAELQRLAKQMSDGGVGVLVFDMRLPRASMFPLTTAPSAMARRGALISPSTDAAGCRSTLSVAVTFPMTAPQMSIDLAVRFARIAAPAPMINP